MREKISILIPTYNREKYIGDCIASALSQTYDNFEIIVVDNASTDSTWEICQHYADADHRVKAFQNSENVGPVRNWKKCLEYSSGDYIKFLFSDDLLYPNCLEEMAPYLATPEIGLVYCAADIGEAPENTVIYFQDLKSSDRISKDVFIQKITVGQAPVSPGAVLLRKRDAEKNLMLDFNTKIPHSYANHGAGPDVWLSLNTAKDYAKVACISKPLVFFRAHPGSFTIENKNNEIAESYISVICLFLKENCDERLLMNYVAQKYLAKVKSQRQLISLTGYAKIHEVFADFRNILILLLISLKIVGKRVFGGIRF